MTAKKILLLLVLLFCLRTEASLLTDEITTLGCSEIMISQSPENLPGGARDNNSEKWCYAEFEKTSAFKRFLFNADGDGIKPELALLIRRDGTLVHGSIFQGEMTRHRVPNIGVNPMPVPMTPPARLIKTKNLRSRWDREIQSTLESFSKVDRQRNAATRKIVEGTFEAHVDPKDEPRAAYWWPHQGIPLSSGPFSPLGKYDAYVEALTGTNPKSSEWENINHSLQSVPWGGHCNGWAASVMLYPPVLSPLWEPKTKKVFMKSDIDGMYAEASFCVNWAFYGKRYNVSTDDINDIYPDRFHSVLLYYINNLKKPIVFDHYNNEGVDNNVISGYKLTIQKDDTDPLIFHVTADLSAHAYPQDRNERDEVARPYGKRYTYDLTTDAQGNVVSGKWLIGNPDFLWVPLSQSRCGRENPRVDHTKIDQLVATLKPAAKRTTALNFMLDRALEPEEEIEVPIPNGKIDGMITSIKAIGGDNAEDYVTVVVEGYNGYANTSHMSHRRYILSWWMLKDLKASHPPLNSITKIYLRNHKSDVATKSTHFEIQKIEFLGEEIPAPTNKAGNRASF